MTLDIATFSWPVALVIFAAYCLVDGLYALYTLEVVNLNATKSATIGALMHFLLGFGVLNYIDNALYLLPLALGSWVGTFVLIQWQKGRAHD